MGVTPDNKDKQEVELFDLSHCSGPHSLQTIQDTVFTVWQVPGDGNCFFHALSLALYGNFFRSNYLRTLICTNVIENWDVWQDLALLSHDVAMNTPIRYHQHMMLKNGWATACEIKVACILLDVNIATYVEGRRFDGINRCFNRCFNLETHSSSDFTEKTITLLLSNSHYSVLTKEPPVGEPSPFICEAAVSESINLPPITSPGFQNSQVRKRHHLSDNIENKAKKSKSNIEKSYPHGHDEVELTNTTSITSDSLSSLPKVEADMFQKCRKLGLRYQGPSENETLSQQKSRRQRNAYKVSTSEKKNKVNVDDLPPPPPLTHDSHYNHTMDCIRAFEVQQMSYTFKHCLTCHERRIHINSSDDNLCRRCSADKKLIKLVFNRKQNRPKTCTDRATKFVVGGTAAYMSYCTTHACSYA